MSIWRERFCSWKEQQHQAYESVRHEFEDVRVTWCRRPVLSAERFSVASWEGAFVGAEPAPPLSPSLYLHLDSLRHASLFQASTNVSPRSDVFWTSVTFWRWFRLHLGSSENCNYP